MLIWQAASSSPSIRVIGNPLFFLSVIAIYQSLVNSVGPDQEWIRFFSSGSCLKALHPAGSGAAIGIVSQFSHTVEMCKLTDDIAWSSLFLLDVYLLFFSWCISPAPKVVNHAQCTWTSKKIHPIPFHSTQLVPSTVCTVLVVGH